MALRGKKPEERSPRLKLLMSAPAGAGKTTAAIQMPRPYIMDTEKGTEHYGDIIEASGGVVFEPVDVHDVIKEIRSLMSEKHDYLTLVIDPINTLYDLCLDEGKRQVGDDFGRHYGYANSIFKRLCALLTTIDMNVIVTAHEKKEYGEDMKVVGMTFDGYKKLDYIFDLWLQLSKNRDTKERTAEVRKTRLREFPDGEVFPWSYENIVAKYGRDRLEAGVTTTELATPQQVNEFKMLASQLGDEGVKKLKIDKAIKSVGDIADMPAERIEKGIELMRNELAVMA